MKKYVCDECKKIVNEDKTIIMYDASGKGSVNYLNLAREILQKNGLTKISNEERMIEVDEEEEQEEGFQG
jgi:chromosome partitioning protein